MFLYCVGSDAAGNISAGRSAVCFLIPHHMLFQILATAAAVLSSVRAVPAPQAKGCCPTTTTHTTTTTFIDCPTESPRICPTSKRRLALLHGNDKGSFRADQAECACGEYGFSVARISQWNREAADQVMEKCGCNAAWSGPFPEMKRVKFVRGVGPVDPEWIVAAHHEKDEAGCPRPRPCSCPQDCHCKPSCSSSSSSSSSQSCPCACSSSSEHCPILFHGKPAWVAPVNGTARFSPCFYYDGERGRGVETMCESGLRLPVLCKGRCGQYGECKIDGDCGSSSEDH